MQRITRFTRATSLPLYSVATTRAMEQQAAAALPAHTLMQRAGLATAKLALALAPHAQRIWIACGPGNNGGDGFEAALHLHRWGKNVVLTWTGPSTGLAGKAALPPDAQLSHGRALAAGVPVAEQPPADFDFCIDALLGIGATADPQRPGSAKIHAWLALIQASGQPCLCVDVPTWLDADTGHILPSSNASSSGRRFTLSLLTLKPGLFTAQGRDCAGEVWFDDLGVTTSPPPDARLLGEDRALPRSRVLATHASHKGSFGDVAVIGGESTARSHMAGAALLAARAALFNGAGRVFVALLGEEGQTALTVDPVQPELMFRSPDALDLKTQVVVCGCGGGEAVRAVLPKVLSSAPRLVLDADALNAIASDSALQTLLKARHGRGYKTVLTPHPLEAARLAGITAADVQANRLKVAAQLAESFGVVVVLKGSGSVIASPGQTSCINPTGNALLATAGTGDVLAGMVGAAMAGGQQAFEAACSAVFTHGRMADDWLVNRPHENLTASALCRV
ncbi:MAG: NAD(P)H-hydrate dehydratase [Polaromonas sp.]|uniref:NAD(P)H-hydrate dehydratase n=1 Tax=Polaromonas sp. TaxID=1869339 RepID=UPI0025DBB92B|nr:NAD(P)H-hydrate dehydratase [Polaromonas sp.]MBI2724844.1 NAD(P)H-hydrate dehydratase [Polaromonas sp.]